MNRKWERTLIRILGIWQIIDGLITILVYGTYKKFQSAVLIQQAAPEKLKAIESISGSLYMVICIFGILLIGFGLFHSVCAKKYVKDDEVQMKMAIWFLACGLFSYFVMDLLSLVLCMSISILLFAKNKSIGKIKKQQKIKI